jgi:hypothetical protein
VPNDKNELTKEEHQKVIDWLSEKKAANTKCPMCEFDSWGIGSSLVLQPVYVPGGFPMGSGYPAVIVFCNRCAYIRLHNANAIGIVTTPPKEQAHAEEQPQSEEVKRGA